jgi:hypothetical protein
VRVLDRYPRYGLSVVDFMEDDTDCSAEEVAPRLGGLHDLERVVRETGADVLLIADGEFCSPGTDAARVVWARVRLLTRRSPSPTRW